MPLPGFGVHARRSCTNQPAIAAAGPSARARPAVATTAAPAPTHPLNEARPTAGTASIVGSTIVGIPTAGTASIVDRTIASHEDVKKELQRRNFGNKSQVEKKKILANIVHSKEALISFVKREKGSGQADLLTTTIPRNKKTVENSSFGNADIARLMYDLFVVL